MDQALAREVIDNIRQADGANRRLSTGGMTLKANVPGEESVVAKIKPQVPRAIREGVPYDANIPAYEKKTTDANAGDSETFSLSHGLIDADAVADDIVVYEDDGAGCTDVTADVTADYANDSFDYTDDGTENDLHVFYISDEQAQITFKKVSPKNLPHQLDQRDAGLLNLRDQNRDPLDFTFQRPFEGWIPQDWQFKVLVDAPYQIQWATGTNNEATARNALLSFPTFISSSEIPGLKRAVRQEASEV